MSFDTREVMIGGSIGGNSNKLDCWIRREEGDREYVGVEGQDAVEVKHFSNIKSSTTPIVGTSSTPVRSIGSLPSFDFIMLADEEEPRNMITALREVCRDLWAAMKDWMVAL